MNYGKPIMLRIRRFFSNLLLLLISISLALFMLELVLRLTPYKKLMQGGLPRYYFTNDEKAGHDISANVAPIDHGICGGYAYKIWSNELGCFDENYKGEKDYILLAGDSFVWGFARYEKKFGKYIEDCLSCRVLKCGVPAYGTLQEYYKIKKIAGKTGIAPKLIIVGYFLGNDLEDDFVKETVMDGYLIRKEEIDIYTGKGVVYSDEELREKISNFEKFGAVFKDSDSAAKKAMTWLAKNTVMGRYLASLNFARMIAKKTDMIKDEEFIPFLSFEKYPCLEKMWRRHLDNLRAIEELAREYNAGLLIVLIPTREQVYDFLRAGKDYDWGRPNRILAEFFKKEGNMYYLDLTGAFRTYADERPKKYLDDEKDFYWRYDGHWSEKGNELAGLLIAKYILDNNMLEIPEKDSKAIKIKDRIRKITGSK